MTARIKAEIYWGTMEIVFGQLQRKRKRSTEEALALVPPETVDYPRNLLRHLVDNCRVRRRLCWDGRVYLFVNPSYTSRSEEKAFQDSFAKPTNKFLARLYWLYERSQL